MKVYLGSDHGGFELKKELLAFLEENGYETEDMGPYEYDAEDDYPDYGKKVAHEVAKEGKEIGQQNSMGVLICRSAAGVIIVANKVKGIRGVAAFSEEQAKHSREHNDANVLGLSGDGTEPTEAKHIVHTWLETPFSAEERHVRRLKKIAAMER